MITNSPILFSFFERLRKTKGIDLERAQYQLLLKAIMLGEGWQGKESIRQLCKTLWLSKSYHENEFDRLFEEEYPYYFSKIEQLTDQDTTSQKSIDQAEQHSPKEEDAPKETTGQKEALPKADEEKKDESLSNFEAINLIFKNGGSNQAAPADLDLEDTYLQHKFTYANKFLPLSDRQLERLWKRFRLATVYYQGGELDIKRMVIEMALHHRLSKFWYQNEKKNKQEVLLIIDHSRSMAPFLPMEEQLFRTIENSRNFSKVNRLYFCGQVYIEKINDQPQYKLFHDRIHSKSLIVNEYWKKLSPNTLILFFSDARHKASLQINFYMWQMLDFMRMHTPAMAWINPLPKDRWTGTNTEDLDSFIPLFEYNKSGFLQLLKHMHQQQSK